MDATLSISNGSIKVLSAKGRQVKKWGSLALESGLVKDGLILRPEATGEAIAALFKSAGIPRERVIASLSGMAFTYRFINMPRMKPGRVDEAVRRAARKEISLPLDELYISWQALPGGGDGQDYFVLGVPRRFADALAETLKIAGIGPHVMDLQPLALARAADRREAIVVNMEPDSSDIIFIAGGVPVVMHSISPRSEGATLEDNIKRLADELVKTAAFYQSRHPESAISPALPLLLTGELASEKAVGGLLQSEVEYDIEPLSPPVDAPPELPVPLYAANIGLALKKNKREVGPGKNDPYHDIKINVFSDKYRKPRVKPPPISQVILWALPAIAIATVIPLYLALGEARAENARLGTEFNDISGELGLATLVSEGNARTEATIEKINTAADSLRASDQNLLARRGVFTRDLQMIIGALPASTYITSIETDGGAITVRGETDSVFKAVEYATILKSIRPFTEVRISELDEIVRTITGDDASDEVPATTKITFGVIINK
jgi:Tfp pilus assembly PilM family ATPase